MALFLLANGPIQSTSAFAKVATGTALKTMLQFQPSATLLAKIIEWGYSLDGAVNGTVELIETTVAATVTAFVAADLTKLDAAALSGGDPTTNLIQVGTANSGYTASGEGSVTTVRNLAAPQTPTSPIVFEKQFPLGREPVVQAGKFVRIRMNFGTSVNAFCYMVVEL